MQAVNKCIKCGEKTPLYSYVATLNTKLRAVAEAAMRVVRVKFCQITYEHQENIMELEQALAAAGFGGESDDK